MEKALRDYLAKRYGGCDWVSAEVTEDNGKTVWVVLDFGDDEIIHVVINRRNGYNGNYRVVSEG